MDQKPTSRRAFLPWLEHDLEHEPGQREPWVRVAWIVASVLAGGALLIFPFVVTSMIGELREGESQRLYDLRTGQPVVGPEEGNSGAEYLNVAVVGLDEVSGSVTLAVSGNRACVSCPLRLMTFFALDDDASQRRGQSPFARVLIGAGDKAFSQTVTLPVRGSPTRYPFDVYRLRLGLQVPAPDSTSAGGAGDAPPGAPGATPSAGGRLATPAAGAAQDAPPPPDADGRPDAAIRQVPTLQNQLNRFVMGSPVAVDAARLPSASGPLAPSSVLDLTFRRPTYLPVLAVLLVVLVAASSGLALATQSADSLMLGVGSLILAIWGVRSVLVPTSLQAVTAVDLALSGVILLLLVGVALRAAAHLQRRAGYRVSRHRRR